MDDSNVNYNLNREDFFDAYYEHPQFFLLNLKWRRVNKKCSIVITFGEQRSGKSNDDIVFCEELEPDWKVEENCFFSVADFLKVCKKGEKGAKYRQFVLEETSVNISNREWYLSGNKAVERFMATQGYRGNILFLNLPVLSHLDKPAIELCHYTAFCPDQGIVMFRRLRPNLPKKLLLRGGSFFCPPMRMRQATKRNWDIYTDMKEPWNQKLLDDDVELLEGFKPRHLNEQRVLQLFSQGVIDEAKAREKLKSIRFSNDDITLLLTKKQEEEPYIPPKVSPERLKEIEELINKHEPY